MGALGRARAFAHEQWLRLSPWSRTWLPRGLAVVGYALLAMTLVQRGDAAFDAAAYWGAAVNAREGAPLYLVHEGEYMSYAYPPVLAQVLVPLSFLPLGGFVWVWRAVELLALRVATGSWTGAGLTLLLIPPVLAEIDAGNVHLLMAAACALAMRGHGWAVAPAALLKFASAPLVPMSWVLDRRGLLIGVAATAAVVLASYAIAPGAWSDYIAFLRTTSFPTGWYNLAENVPLPLRLAGSVALGFAAIRWLRLAPFAVLLAYPVLWVHALSTLVAALGPVAAPPATVRGVAPDAARAGDPPGSELLAEPAPR